MRLTRRHALAALGVAGAGGALGVASGVAGRGAPRADDGARLDRAARETLAAAAEVLYPSAVSGHREFVETYALGRTAGRRAYRAGLAAALAELDAAARDWYDAPFARLAPETRDRLLRELGADVADPDPEGSVSERLRLYVVDELLYALYASPVGGRLAGIENPTGYPGGTASYRRSGPDAPATAGPDEAWGGSQGRPSADGAGAGTGSGEAGGG
jgi:hypothetical protein